MRIAATLGRKARVARSLAFETFQVFREEGARAAMRLASSAVRSAFGTQPPTAKVNPVDEEFGTDTAADAKLHGLDIASRNVRYAVYYRATNYPILREVLSKLAIPHSRYTFVDCGSGKGLVLLEAAAYPFRKVIGVEFARELHEIARQNVARYPQDLLRAPIELVCDDAIAYEPPEGNLVIYLYEPFEPPLVQAMIARVETLRRGRDLIVAHVFSTNRRINSRKLWDSAAFLEKTSEGPAWAIYRSAGDFRPPPG
jgi:predicted RNA methylase